MLRQVVLVTVEMIGVPRSGVAKATLPKVAVAKVANPKEKVATTKVSPRDTAVATTTVGSPSGISNELTDSGQNMHGIHNFQKHPALQLPHVGSANFDRVIEVKRFCAIELFCGCMAVTMDLMFLKVPTCCVWDGKCGEALDIFKHGQQLLMTFDFGNL